MFADMADLNRGTRQDQAPGFFEYMTNQTASVEAAFRGGAAVFVMDAQHTHGLHGQFGCVVGDALQLADLRILLWWRRFGAPRRTRQQAER